MTQKQLFEFVSSTFPDNEDALQLAYYTVEQHFKSSSNENELKMNLILSNELTLKQIKKWNKVMDKLDKCKTCSDGAFSIPYGNGKINGDSLVIKVLSYLEDLNIDLKYIDSRSDITTGPLSTGYYTEWVYDKGFDYQKYAKENPWGNVSIQRYKDENRIIKLHPLSIKANDPKHYIKYFVGDDIACNNLRRLIINLEHVHIQEHQKQLDENKYDKLPFELNELLQEYAHKLLLECEDYVKHQLEMSKIRIG